MSQRILITGANGGFGELTTRALLEAGHTVAASMRDPDGRNQSAAEALQAAGAHIVDIDVTSGDSVKSGVQAAIESAGGLDVLINNAGVGVMGLQENYTASDMQRLFDINVFGVQRMNRAVLPLFRKQASGLLLHVSSLLGRITIPFYGPYNSSKWALEALAENYRTELSAFGVDSCLVEPGGFPTSFVDRLMRPSDTTRDTEYGEFAEAPAAALAGFEAALAANPAQDPAIVAEAIVAVVETPAGERPFRTVVDKMGMGEPIEAYNQHLAEVTTGIYTAFGTSDMLKLKVGES
ncbi:MAG: SDR family oxidoreductase [Woeseiaceae bacterium]|nr:SDR family oxidoreductase [Woeseiaceae bacterium]